jgi:hypothetical protein
MAIWRAPLVRHERTDREQSNCPSTHRTVIVTYCRSKATLGCILCLTLEMPIDPHPPDTSGPDTSKTCEERARLLRGHADAASSYARRVLEMAELVISGQEHRVAEARRHCRTAWEQTENSRLALARHEADHACDRGAQVPSICGE